MIPLETLVLEGPGVRLEPLGPGHVEGLLAAASEDHSTYGLSFVPRDREEAQRYVEEALEEHGKGLALPFATVDRVANRIVGSTRFGSVERWVWRRGFSPPAPVPVGPDAVEIGWTWLAASAQRTGVNSQAKWLMLTHAFEVWRVRRVVWGTDARNERSRRAIARLGATFDGVLRAHRPGIDGTVRDTAFFSMLREEWPAAKASFRCA